MRNLIRQAREAFVPTLAILAIIAAVGGCVKYKHSRFKRMYPNATTLDFIIK